MHVWAAVYRVLAWATQKILLHGVLAGVHWNRIHLCITSNTFSIIFAYILSSLQQTCYSRIQTPEYSILVTWITNLLDYTFLFFFCASRFRVFIIIVLITWVCSCGYSFVCAVSHWNMSILTNSLNSLHALKYTKHIRGMFGLYFTILCCCQLIFKRFSWI